MNLTLVVELILTALLAATLFYCIVLERKLAALRSGQDGLKKTLASLNGAVAAAGVASVPSSAGWVVAEAVCSAGLVGLVVGELETVDWRSQPASSANADKTMIHPLCIKKPRAWVDHSACTSVLSITSIAYFHGHCRFLHPCRNRLAL